MALHNDIVRLEGSRGTSPRVYLSCRACVMLGGFDDPALDTQMSSVRRAVTVIIRKRELGTVIPQTGDVVVLEDGSRFKVVTVSPFINTEFNLDCRSC